VFKVMYETQPGTMERMGGVSPEELADVTARQAFVEADVDEDGMLTWEEFQDWYSTPADTSAGAITAAADAAPGWVTLGEVRRLTNLGSFSVDEVLELFANATDEDGYISTEDFADCFEALVGAGPEQSDMDQDKTRMVLSRLYNIFDTDGDGVVDFTELSTGLTVLCGGTRDEKAAAAFSLYDYNGDGVISLDEMTRYLTSVFKVMYEAQPGTAERMGGVSPEELADVTARQAFVEADVDEDGMLTFEEFQDWYSTPGDSSAGAITAAVDAAPGWVSLGEVRRLTNLGSFSVDEVLELFANATDEDGYVSTEDFADCFEALVGAGPEQSDMDQDKTRMVLSRLYNIFDTNGDGVVDFTELSTGLTVLCGGTRDEKAAAAFSLYDYNGDGVISLDEMTRYLTSVFKVMYETQPGTMERMGGVSPEELADVTARQAFVEADVDEDGMLTWEEFQDWYSTPADTSAGAITAAADAAPGWVTLGEVRRLTNLGSFSVDEVLELFANATDEDGYISAGDFGECFDVIIGAGPEQSMADEDRTRVVLSRLYDIFDTDGDGVVDFTELSTGLTVLCGGTRDEKAAAAFSLYDYNGDGVISLDEMTRYLTSVFKVMYEAQPGTMERMGGVSPEELADVTARQAFIEADVDEDGMLTFEEFQDWYSTPTDNSAGAITAAADAAPGWVSLGEVRRLTNLGSFSVDEVLELFANATDEDGYVSAEDFDDCFEALVEAGPTQNYEDQEKTRMVLSRLYTLFDTNSDGVVDFTELATGLTVLCGGTRDEKAAAAFSLYDYNGDGVISLDEMTRYLTSVFKVMFEAQPGTAERMGVSPEELADVTARQAFIEADVDEDGMLTFEEFQGWYSTPGQ
jgi:Ca2+-binding EF-hand superfamily protein